MRCDPHADALFMRQASDRNEVVFAVGQDECIAQDQEAFIATRVSIRESRHALVWRHAHAIGGCDGCGIALYGTRDGEERRIHSMNARAGIGQVQGATHLPQGLEGRRTIGRQFTAWHEGKVHAEGLGKLCRLELA